MIWFKMLTETIFGKLKTMDVTGGVVTVTVFGATYVATNVADELGAGKAIKKVTRKTADTVQQEWNDGWERDYQAGGISSVGRNSEAEMA
ncbi:hypothetical protein AM228_20895 [Planktothricoides sp. SR001]|uniref:hypothetical protein n=1 Tax=Planktothricoides sp. SR001 TaxID=1705388 RepID=UPI0006BFC307|nr:hypothetical protein [Planktothricoides sp. SR001]KOR34981.1 hypothetical protein AM228_20895 [Planktothricoides sp. SR001]